MERRLRVALLSMFVLLMPAASAAVAQIPGQLAHDFRAGKAPEAAEIAALEKEVALHPNDPQLVRKLGKGYFFEFFDLGERTAVPKADKTLERALALKNDDPETLAYLGALQILKATELQKGKPAAQKAGFDRGFELVRKAESLDPRNGAVMSVACASYLWLPESYGMTKHVIEIVEGMRAAMGPMFKKYHHHGQQRLLMTLGQAYARTGETEKARALFDEALAVNGTSREAGLLRHEIAKLPAPRK